MDDYAPLFFFLTTRDICDIIKSIMRIILKFGEKNVKKL